MHGGARWEGRGASFLPQGLKANFAVLEGIRRDAALAERRKGCPAALASRA
jgi:hypothetical protein